MKISVETIVKAAIATVWSAYTTPNDIVQWNAASDDWQTTTASVDLRVGGTFSSHMQARDGSVGFDFAGEYTKIVHHEVLEYTFGDRHASVTFVPNDQGVLVRVAFDPELENSVELQQQGWQAILDNFARYVTARH